MGMGSQRLATACAETTLALLALALAFGSGQGMVSEDGVQPEVNEKGGAVESIKGKTDREGNAASGTTANGHRDVKERPRDGGTPYKGEGDRSAGGEAATGKDAEAENHYADAEAGYSLTIPRGWRKVTDKEVREIFRGMLKAFGKKAVETVLQRPPVYFEGPNPRDPMKIWENFGVGHIPTTFILDPGRLDEYRGMVEKQLKSEETPYEDARVNFVEISGILSIRIDYATRRRAISPLKMLVSHVLIPAEDRTFELVFIFDPSRKEEMERVMGEVLDSFVVTNPPKFSWSSKWTRIAILTAAGFVGGVFLGLLIQRLSNRRRSSVSPSDKEMKVG